MFQTENDLVISIRDWVDSESGFVSGEKQSLLSEVDLGYGRADLVAVGFNNCDRSNRKHHLEYYDISLLSYIEEKERVTLEEMSYITRSPERRINRSLEALINDEFITYRKGHYYSHKKYADSLTDSIAIEAKLKNWKRALTQAFRYKWFANKSYVFLPVENIAVPKANIDMFQKYNVGLASVTDKKNIDVIFEPERETPISSKMRMALNEHLLFQDSTDTRSF